MNSKKAAKQNFYYTHDHEWIDFQGSVAYIGVCSFKLKGIKQIQKIMFSENSGLIRQGALIATIQYDDYLVNVNMPVEGKILSINDMLLTDEQNILLKHPESKGWIALIFPRQIQERNNLLPPEEYEHLQKIQMK